jgi:LysR family transcriptional regulator for metE and metH
MELRHLKMIKEVAKHGSLTLAADHLFLSQSALSHQLKDIEDYFKTQIFIRQKKKMLLTDTGKIILAASEKIIEEIEGTKGKIKLLTEKDAGEVRISTECYTSYHWLSGFLMDFKQSYPKVEVIIIPEATYNSESLLLENKIDVAIIANNLNQKFDYTPLFTDEFIAVVSNDHPWTSLNWVSAEAFANETYIMYNLPKEKSSIYGLLFKEKEPKKLYKIMLTEAIVQMVKANLGVTALPNWVVRPYIESGQLTAIPITRKGVKRIWYAATLKSKQQPKFINDFSRKLAKHLKRSEDLAFYDYC